MAVNQPLSSFQMERRDEVTTKAIATGMRVEAIGGGAGLVLSILCLVGIFPMLLASIALIVLGAALFIESSAVAANVRTLNMRTGTNKLEDREFVTGVNLTTLGAIAAVALGILALIGIAQPILLAVGVITIGASGVLGGSEEARVGNYERVEAYATKPEDAQLFSRKVVAAPVGLQVLSGVAAMVLGILALCAVNPFVMMTVGLLVISSGMFLAGAILTGGMTKLLAR